MGLSFKDQSPEEQRLKGKSVSSLPKKANSLFYAEAENKMIDRHLHTFLFNFSHVEKPLVS